MPSQHFNKLKIDRKNSIIKALTRQFATLDYAEISVRDISECAGISRGSFYLYFQDKQDAFLTVVDAYRNRIEQDLLNIYEKAGNIEEIVMEIFDYFTHLSAFEHSLLEKISNNLSIEVQDILGRMFDQFGLTITEHIENKLKSKNIEITPELSEQLNLRREILFGLLVASLLELSLRKKSLDELRDELRKKTKIVISCPFENLIS